MNAPLYSLVDSYIAALERVDPDTGEVDAETHEVLCALSPAITERVEACAAVRARYLAEAEANDELAKAYHAKSVARGKEADRLERYVLGELQRAGMQKVKGATATVWLAQSVSVAVTAAPETLPAQYQRHVPARIEADKKALKAALDAGETIEGVALETATGVRFR
jgi:hypothetical protein